MRLPYFSIAKAPLFAKAVVGDLKIVAKMPVDLQPVASINLKMDPWRKDSSSIQKVWTTLCSEKTRQTNQFCVISQNIVSDKSESVIEMKYENGKKLEIETSNLTYDEIMYHINRINYEMDATKQVETESKI